MIFTNHVYLNEVTNITNRAVNITLKLAGKSEITPLNWKNINLQLQGL